MVTTICDNCGAEYHAWPPSRGGPRHEPWCEKCKADYDRKKLAGEPKQVKKGVLLAPQKTTTLTGSDLHVAQAVDFIEKWENDTASDMNIDNILRLKAILLGKPEGGYLTGDGLDCTKVLPVEPVNASSPSAEFFGLKKGSDPTISENWEKLVETIKSADNPAGPKEMVREYIDKTDCSSKDEDGYCKDDNGHVLCKDRDCLKKPLAKWVSSPEYAAQVMKEHEKMVNLQKLQNISCPCPTLLFLAKKAIFWHEVAKQYAEAAEFWRLKYHREHSFTLACCRQSITVQVLLALEKGEVTRARIRQALDKALIDERNVYEQVNEYEMAYDDLLQQVLWVLSIPAKTWHVARKGIRSRLLKARNALIHLYTPSPLIVKPDNAIKDGRILAAIYRILVRYFSDEAMIKAGEAEPATLATMNLDIVQPTEWYHDLVHEILQEFRSGHYQPSKEGVHHE